MYQKYSYKIARTREEMKSIYRLRYKVYVEEMQKFLTRADHKNKILSDPMDAFSVHFYVTEENRTVGAFRLQTGFRESFNNDDLEELTMQPVLDFLGPERVCILSRLIFEKKYRCKIIPVNLLKMAFEWNFEKKKILVLFLLCEENKVNLFMRMGCRRYTRHFVYPGRVDYQRRVPLVLFSSDYPYLKESGSFLYRAAKKHGFPGFDVPAERIKRLFPIFQDSKGDNRNEYNEAMYQMRVT